MPSDIVFPLTHVYYVETGYFQTETTAVNKHLAHNYSQQCYMDAILHHLPQDRANVCTNCISRLW